MNLLFIIPNFFIITSDSTSMISEASYLVSQFMFINYQIKEKVLDLKDFIMNLKN